MVPAISVRQLQYFVSVYEERAFSRAAERENCTQPALSAQIRNLEEVLGASLFDRSVAGVVPTLVGQRLYRHAIAILRAVKLAEMEVKEISGKVSGIVKAGLVPSVVRGLATPFLPDFVSRYPEVLVSLSEAFSGTLTEWVMAGDLDFAIVVEPPNREGLIVSKVLGGMVALLSGAALGFETRQPVRLRDLPPVDMVVPSTRHALRARIDRSCHAGELKIRRMLEMDSVSGMIEFVKATKWVTILPGTAILCDAASETDALRVNPIQDETFRADHYLIHLERQPLSLAGQTFVDVLAEHFARAQKKWLSTGAAEVPQPA